MSCLVYPTLTPILLVRRGCDNHRKVWVFQSDCSIFIQHWTKLDRHEGEPCPMGRSAHAAVCLDYGDHPQLLVTGGRSVDGKALRDAWMLDVQSGRWREVRLKI